VDKSNIGFSTIILRLTAIVSVAWAIGHTYGTLAIINGPSNDALDSQILMVESVAKTFTDVFSGYGYFITVYMLMQAAVLWLISILMTKEMPVTIFIWVVMIGSLSTAVISVLYLIIIPVIFSMIIAILLAIVLIHDKLVRQRIRTDFPVPTSVKRDTD